jgi:hypothetical protein
MSNYFHYFFLLPFSVFLVVRDPCGRTFSRFFSSTDVIPAISFSLSRKTDSLPHLSTDKIVEQRQAPPMRNTLMSLRMLSALAGRQRHAEPFF